MAKTPEEYEARIQELEAELDRLKTGCRLTLHAMPVTRAPGGSPSGTVVGVEEMILQVGSDRGIAYMNGPIAKLLQVEDRKAVHNLTALAERDDLPAMGFHLEVLSAIVDTAFASNKESVVETVFPGLPFDLLPPAKGERPATDPVLRFVATPVSEQVQVVVQDVTRVRWLESMFSRYVSPHVLEMMQTTESADYMKAELREVSVLFADLRGFTAMCEGMDPEDVRETVNSFLTGMVACIEGVGGTVDKFVGDEVMALFGAPLNDPAHALNALICALRMQEVHQQWVAERKQLGKAAPPLGIGLATGRVVVGNVGTPTRVDYTALGRTVNLAARLCGSASGGEILTIRGTHEAGKAAAATRPKAEIPHLRFTKKGMMEFKNIKDKVEVIRVFGGDG